MEGGEVSECVLQNYVHFIAVDDITIVNSQMASLMQQRTRPPLPPASRSPMNVRQDDLIQLRQKQKLKMTAKYCDVAVIYSSRCQVSGEWARFISALMKQQGYQNVMSQCIDSEFLGINNYGHIKVEDISIKQRIFSN